VLCFMTQIVSSSIILSNFSTKTVNFSFFHVFE